jgi:hypothetical protein
VPGLEADRLRKNLKKPISGSSLKRRIEETEKQLETLVDEDLVVESEAGIETNQDKTNSQTQDIISIMGDKKNMVLPGSRDAPKFSSSRPKELRRFIRQIEDLWKEAGITQDEEKKSSLGKYADQESEEEWSALETYSPGHTWEEFRKEILENYPEASAAERGTPFRIRQIVQEADHIEMGDTTRLYTYRRAFLAEASKLLKKPAVMSNRELVELFMGGLAQSFVHAVLQYLGGLPAKKAQEKPKEGEDRGETPEGSDKKKEPGEVRRPEDKYDLDEVCRAAREVSENAQGILSYGWGVPPNRTPKRGSALVQASSGESPALATKLETLEEAQALEKDRLDVVNKQWSAKLESIEGLMKTLLSQAQEKPSSNFVQNVGMGSRMGNQAEPPGRGFKTFSSGSDFLCFGCGLSGHFQNECERVKALLAKGLIVHNRDGRVCLPDGSRVPNIPAGAYLADRVERYYANLKPTQSYYGAFEEMEDKMHGSAFREATHSNREMEEREQRIARLEKEYELKERESALNAKQFKQEAKVPDRAEVRAYLLEHFDEDLAALRDNKQGFL